MADKNLSQQDKKKLQVLIDELDQETEALASDVKKTKQQVQDLQQKAELKKTLEHILTIKE